MGKKSLVPEVLQKGELQHNTDPMAMMMAQLFGSVSAQPTPTLDVEAGLFTRTFHVWKMRALAETSTHEATIAQNFASIAKSRLELMTVMMNFPLLLEASRNQIKHDRKMQKLLQRDVELTNALKEIEVKRTASELSQLLKELGLGTSTD